MACSLVAPNFRSDDVQDGPVQIDQEDARQGKRGTKVSFVLAISLALAVIIGIILYAKVF